MPKRKLPTKKIALVVLAGGAVVAALALPVSNLLGLGRDEPIAVQSKDAAWHKVSPLLQAKCADCHAPALVVPPFYAELPVARRMIEQDRRLGAERFDLSYAQLAGGEPPTDIQLARLEATLDRGDMPPAAYLGLHWTSALSRSEQQAIRLWIAGSRERLPGAETMAEPFRGQAVQPLSPPSKLDAQKVALGDLLYHDKRLSGDDTISCASCHDLSKGGTDQARVATGIDGQQGPISSPTTFNSSYNVLQFWDGRARDLQEQAGGPVENPSEMGAQFSDVIAKLKKDAELVRKFSEIYPDEGITKSTITDAIAEFERSLVTPGSRFDQHLRGRSDALTSVERQGWELFKALTCTSCHFGPALGGRTLEKLGVVRDYFAERGQVREVDHGRYNQTKRERDRHVFKVPVLRNIAVTYPYLHDGSAPSLDIAVQVMARYQVGRKLTPDETAQVVAFLATLTGRYRGKPVDKL